jgi:hypothetical protein
MRAFAGQQTGVIKISWGRKLRSAATGQHRQKKDPQDYLFHVD